jgi:hypothetical protein
MLKYFLGIHAIKQTIPRQYNVKKTQSYDPIPPVAKEISEEAWLLCFDEFQVRIHSQFKKSVISYNADENKRTSEVTIGIILANGKDVADRLLQEDISDANAVMEDDTKDVKEALSDAIRYAAVVVEETLDSPWVTDQSTFNYRLDCALEDSLAVAVVFHGANHKDKLILDDSGLYKYPFDINASFPAMSKMCIPIVVPKSGINTLVADDGTIEVYRNWWMTTGEVDDTGIIVREEEEEINEFIELLKLAKEVAKKPVYIMYGNGYNDKGYLYNPLSSSINLSL